MKNTALVFGLVASFSILVIALGLFFPVTPRALALGNPCALDPNNLIVNGSMAAAVPPNNTVYGEIAANWSPFVSSPEAPIFEHVTNEQIDPNGSQYIWSDYAPYGAGPFDAGIYQTVTGLSAGQYYHFWLGYALAAYDPGDQQNHRGNWIGRQVGVDTSGGTDPNSANVRWSDVYWIGDAALNIPALNLVFTPQVNRATIFLRAINTGNIGRMKVWFDSACMKLMNPQPTLTPTAGPQYLPLIERKPTS